MAKKFADVDAKSVEDVIQFVAPCVLHPEPMVARPVFQEHAGVAWRLAAECMKLHAAEGDRRKGK